MWSRVTYGGLYVPYNYSKFICDTKTDLAELPTNTKSSVTHKIKSCSVGSIAVVIENSTTYILSNSGEWKEFKTASSTVGIDGIDGAIIANDERILIAKS